MKGGAQQYHRDFTPLTIYRNYFKNPCPHFQAKEDRIVHCANTVTLHINVYQNEEQMGIPEDPRRLAVESSVEGP